MSSNQNFEPGPIQFPPQPPTIPPANFRESGKQAGDGLAESELLSGAKGAFLDVFKGAIAWVIVYFITHLSNILMQIADLYLKIRQGLEPVIAKFGSLAVSDLFGTPLDLDAFKRLGSQAERDAVNVLLGQQILKAITGTYAAHPGGTIEPSEVPAEKFLATMSGLTIEGWLDASIASFLSDHPFEKIGELKDDFAKTFGFGRLSRRVLGPYMAELIEKPTQLVLNKKYRPTVLSQGQLIKKWWAGKIERAELNEKLSRLGFADSVIQDLIDEDLPVLTPSQLVHQYNRGLITRDDLTARLNKRGYPNDVIEALVVEGRKYIGTSDIAFLVRNKYWTMDQAVAEYRSQGYSDALARQSLEIDRLQRIDTAKQEYLSVARDLYLTDDIPDGDFNSAMDYVGVEPELKDFYFKTAHFKKERQRKRLSESDAETAVIRGFWTMSEYENFLEHLHYSDSDIITKTLLIADKIQQDDAAKKKRDDAEKARAAARAAKQAAAVARQAQLEALRLHPVLTLAQVAAATVRGFVSIDQYADFLRAQHYGADDVSILTAMVNADRADYLTAQARREKADAKFATTSLTTAQLEKGVEIGALTMDNFRGTLANEGVDAGDIDILAKILQTTLDARDAASSRRDAVASGLTSKGLSLSQMERAVILGLWTLTDYRARLAELGYSVVDQELLSGLLEDQIAKATDTAAKQQAADAAAAVRKIPLADLRAAVRAGLRPIVDYQRALIDLKYSNADVDTMVALLESTIVSAADAAARQAALELAASTMAIPLTVIEAAVALGVTDTTTLADAISEAGGAPEDVAVITADAELWASDITTARRLETDAGQQLARLGKSLPTMKRGLRAGTLTETGYGSALSDVGFGAQSISLMLDLATTENQFDVYAVGVRSSLDRSGGDREIKRAAQELAVREKRGAIADYAAWLSLNGYDQFQAQTLVWLLASELVS